jgi:microcystin-dependent protein
LHCPCGHFPVEELIMSEPFVGEIRLFAGNFAPVDWAFCDGTSLAIAQNEALFDLIGTTYGGNGTTTFNLPDLRGRVPIHQGAGYVLGQSGGAETVTVTAAEAPVHTHNWAVVTSAGSADTEKLPEGYLANGPLLSYDNRASPTTTALASSTIGSAGGGLAHQNMAPFLTICFIISLFGVFPSQG